MLEQVFEIIKLLGKQNLSYSILDDYLTAAIEKSKNCKKNISNNSKGRGSLVTMLSKTTINKVILATLELIRRKVKEELGDKQFSIQVC